VERPADLTLLLTRAERLVARRLKAVLDPLGFTTDAWRVLALLADGGGHTMSEISEQAFLPPATLTKLVDQLAEHNLVYRRIDPVDRRRIRAYLTQRGKDTHARITREIDADWADVPLADADLLAALLKRVIATADPSMIKASLKSL
jgi:MarR family transcriptional regulator, organic hydroperoxide resistance regulator